MHYSAGLAGLAAIGGAATLPGSGLLWLTARLLLDGAGALFGVYLLTVLTLFLSGYVMRLRRRPGGRETSIRESPVSEAAAREPVRP